MSLIKNIAVGVGLIVIANTSCTNFNSAGPNLSMTSDTTKQVIRQIPKQQRQADSLQLLNLLKMNCDEMKILQLSADKSLPSLFSIGAKNMISFHKSAIDELRTINESRNFKLKTQADANVIVLYNKLNKENNKQFEGDFLDWVIKTYKDAIGLCNDYSKNEVDSEVAEWCKSAIPVLQSHLEMAESAEKDIKTNE